MEIQFANKKAQEKPPAQKQPSDRVIRRIQALIRGRISRATYLFLEGKMYKLRDAYSFRHQGHYLNMRILQEYMPGTRKLSPDPKEYLVLANDWTDCVNFNLLTVPANHFTGGTGVTVKNLKDSFEINLFTHELYYRPVRHTTLSYPTDGDDALPEPIILQIEDKKQLESPSDAFGFDEKTMGLLLKLQRVMRGHLSRKQYFVFNKKCYRVLFSGCLRNGKNILNIRILGRIVAQKSIHKIAERIVIVMDLTDQVLFNILEFDSKVFGGIDPTMLAIDDVARNFVIDGEAHRIEYKAPLDTQEDTIPSPIISMRHSEHGSEEKSSKTYEQSYRPLIENVKTEEQQQIEEHEDDSEEDAIPEPLMEKIQEEADSSHRDLIEEVVEPLIEDSPLNGAEKDDKDDDKELILLTNTFIQTSKRDKLEILVYYHPKKLELLLESKSQPPQNLRIPIQQLGMEKFKKKEFLDNIDAYLLSRLLEDNGTLIFTIGGRGETAGDEDDDDPPSISTRNQQFQQPRRDNPPEKIITEFAYEQEFADELADEILDEYVKAEKQKIQAKKKSKGKHIDSSNDGEEEDLQAELNALKMQAMKKANPIPKADQAAATKSKAKPQESEEEELPDLNDPGVQHSAMVIQKAFLKKKNREKKKESPKKPEKPLVLPPQPNYEKNHKSKPKVMALPIKKQTPEEEDDDELPDLNELDLEQSGGFFDPIKAEKSNVQSAAGDLKKETPKRFEEDDDEELPDLNELNIQQSNEKLAQQEERLHKLIDDDDEELPDLNDPEMQPLGQALSQGGTEPQNHQSSEEEEEKGDLPRPLMRGLEDSGEELPDLNDSEVQKPAAWDQQASPKKKMKEKITGPPSNEGEGSPSFSQDKEKKKRSKPPQIIVKARKFMDEEVKDPIAPQTNTKKEGVPKIFINQQEMSGGSSVNSPLRLSKKNTPKKQSGDEKSSPNLIVQDEMRYSDEEHPFYNQEQKGSLPGNKFAFL